MHRDRITLLLLSATLSLGAVVSCTSSEPVNNTGVAGSNGAAGTAGAGNTSGAAGNTSGAAGDTSGAAGEAGTTDGAAGTTAGAAGSTAGAAGSGAAGSTGAAGAVVDAGVDTGPALSFATDIMPIITANCHDCHQTDTDGMLNMKADTNDTLGTTAYTSLVGTGTGGAVQMNKTCKVGGNAITLRVKPGDPMNSLMYLKITTADATLKGDNCGDSMPKNAAGMKPLQMTDPTDVTTIQTWIMQGAKP